VDALCDELTAKYHLDCPVLGDQIEYDEPPFDSDQQQRDLYITVHIPFSGSRDLFQYHGSRSPILMEEIAVESQALVTRVRLQPRNLKELPNIVKALIVRINDGLNPIADRLKHFDRDLKAEATRMLRDRQHQFASHTSLLGQLKTVGFKLRKRDDGKESVIIPVKQKVLQVQAKPTAAMPCRNQVTPPHAGATILHLPRQRPVLTCSKSRYSSLARPSRPGPPASALARSTAGRLPGSGVPGSKSAG
jgi:hypothetical protein